MRGEDSLPDRGLRYIQAIFDRVNYSFAGSSKSNKTKDKEYKSKNSQNK